MSNFDQILGIWGNLDAVKEKKFPNLTNTEFFKKLLGFVNGRSGLANIQGKIMEDLPDDPEVYKKYQRFLKGTEAISALLESGCELTNNCPPSTIYESVFDNSKGELGLTYSGILNGALDIVDDHCNVSVKELLSSGNVMEFCRLDKSREPVFMRARQDPNGYLVFKSSNECVSWLLEKIGDQRIFNALTAFEKSVVVNLLYAAKSGEIRTPCVFLSSEYVACLQQSMLREIDSKKVDDVNVPLNNATVTLDHYDSVSYSFINAFGNVNFVTELRV